MFDFSVLDSAESLSNRGTELLMEGRLDEAIKCLRRATELKPDTAALHFNLGNALKCNRNPSSAIECYRRAVALAPNLTVAHYNLGTTLREMGLLNEAIAHLREATRLEPAFAEAHSNLALALQDQGELDQATASYQRALTLQPTNATNYNNLGNILKKQQRFDEAATFFRYALELKPDYFEAQSNLGTIFQDQGDVDAAIACYRRSLAIRQDYAQAYSNLGTALEQRAELNAAFACYNRAIELEPENAGAHRNRALMTLLGGDFERGWPEYEWRWKTDEMREREFAQPRWAGENLQERTILIWAEQGFGDTFQFIRYAAALKEQGATVVVECQKALTKILTNCRGVDQLITRDDKPPPFDFHAPLLSLPGIFKTGLSSMPAPVPYLFADEALVADWHQRLQPLTGFRIGINWSGREGRGFFRQRDIPLDFFFKLAELPSVRLISLQKGTASSELAAGLPIFDPGYDFDQTRGAFMDTAAIMRNVDLVITSDTSVPHLAGALGVPVWVALPRVPDWRWLLNRTDSPWYPTMRLFRQKTIGDWAAAFGEIKEACQSLIAQCLGGCA